MLRAQRTPASGRLHLKGGSCTRMNIQLGKLPFPAHPPTLQPVSSKRIAPTYVRRRAGVRRTAMLHCHYELPFATNAGISPGVRSEYYIKPCEDSDHCHRYTFPLSEAIASNVPPGLKSMPTTVDVVSNRPTILLSETFHNVTRLF